MTKVNLALEWLGKDVLENPTAIRVFTDFGTVEYGGCSRGQLLANYNRVVVASGGAPVVVGADTAFRPANTRGKLRFDSLRSQRSAVLGAFNLGDWAYRKYLVSEEAEYQYA